MPAKYRPTRNISHPYTGEVRIVWKILAGVHSLYIQQVAKYKSGGEYVVERLFGAVRADGSGGWYAASNTFDIEPKRFADLRQAINYIESLYALEAS